MTLSPPPGYPGATLAGPLRAYIRYWKATSDDREVFIKQIDADTPRGKKRLLDLMLANEARTLDFLADIEGVARLVDFVPDAYAGSILVTEYIFGYSLEHRSMRFGECSAHYIACVYASAARRLQNVHDAGIIHGDIKPGNLMLGGDWTTLIDFGIAHHVATEEIGAYWDNDSQFATATEGPVGTPHFLAPEILREGIMSDVKSDIYSFGCSLHFNLTGAAPFGKLTKVEEVAMAHTHEVPPAPSELVPELGTQFDAIVARCLAKDRDQRYAHMGEVYDDLAELSELLENEADVA